MLRKFGALLLVLPIMAIGVYAQGINTNASSNDWEEINFEFNSSVLVDGFPSLLRLAELLQKNPGFKVKVEGHTDRIGNDRANERLGLARANAVRDFLVKYGARASQIETSTRGRIDPKYAGQKPTFTRTDEARWMNRRVALTVMDDQGRTVGAGGAGDAIRAIEPAKPAMADCCSEVLKRLDKLDEIERMLKDLADQNAALRKEVGDLKQNQQVLESKVNQPQAPVAAPPSTSEVAKAVADQLDKNNPKFQLLGINAGVDDLGHLSVTGRGRYFSPFGGHYAFQAQGEYLYNTAQREGQFDFGLLDRIGRFQGGLFSSFKEVTLTGNQNSGTLGQAALTLDYIFKWGRVGAFGTAAFLNNPIINSTNAVSPTGMLETNVLLQRYLHVINQGGISATAGLFGNNYWEGNIAYLHSATYGDRAGGTLRLVFPLNQKIALTVEGGVNETLVGPGNNGRAVVGVQFGNMMRPKEFLAATHPVPADVPRIRYEVLTRTLRVGNAPPVADAGPNQIGVPAGTITLNGSGSYDPDGDPITFLWTQDGGPAVALSSANTAITTFPAAAGQNYDFKLTVKDSYGATGTARVAVTTLTPTKVQILSFAANPPSILPGQSSTLGWQVIGADTVTITSLGNVALVGTDPVTPAVTTTYVLTATGGGSTITANATVTVGVPQTALLSCFASPSNIMVGESSTLNYSAVNATSVSISNGVGTVGNTSGSVAVSPTATTNYTVTATGVSGTASCTIAVNVTPGQVPRIIQFSAIPATIRTGQTSTLLWIVENATSVTLSSVGNVSIDGTQGVSPAATTVYTLTATNASGSVNALATVNVIVVPPPVVVSFTATPSSVAPGGASALTCVTTGATSVTMDGILWAPGTSTNYVVHPLVTTTYQCIATSRNGATATANATVTVITPTPPPPPPQGPVITLPNGGTITTFERINNLSATVTSPNQPLTYLWTSMNTQATILGPTTANPQVILDPTQVDYYFTLTVTDSKGVSSSAVLHVIYIGSIF